MKKLVQILTVSVFMLASTTVFSIDFLEMRRWDRKMEKLAQAGDEEAVYQEQRALENQLKKVALGSKEAKLLEKKLSKISDYQIWE